MRASLRLVSVVLLAPAAVLALVEGSAHAQFRKVTSLGESTEITGVVGDRVLYSTDSALWSTDGTASEKLLDTGWTILSEGPASRGFGVVGGAYVFSAGSGLHATKGTAATTVLLSKDTQARRARGGNGDDIQVFGGAQAYFNTWAGDVWTTDGTPGGTKKISSLGMPYPGYYTFTFLRAGTTDVFTSSLDDKENSSTKVDDPANDGVWKVSGGSASRIVAGHSYGRASCGPFAYYETSQGLWRTDGSAAGTIAIPPAGTFLEERGCIGAMLVARTSDNVLFVSSGTAATSKSLAEGVDQLVMAGKYAYFTKVVTGATRLWRSDGTAAGTIELAQLAPSSFSQLLGFSDGRLLVGWSTGFVVTDGTVANTKSSTARLELGSGRSFVGSDGKGYFFASDGAHGREPWVTDGTVAGTKMLQDLAPGSSSSVGSDSYAELDGELFITAKGGSGFAQVHALRIKAATPKDGGVDEPSGDGGAKKDGGTKKKDGGSEDGEDQDEASEDGTGTTTTTTTGGCGVGSERSSVIGALFMLGVGLIGARRRRGAPSIS